MHYHLEVNKLNGAIRMQKLDVIHKKLLDEWKKENKRDLKLVGEILQNAKVFLFVYLLFLLIYLFIFNLQVCFV